MVTTRLATLADEPRILELLMQLWGRDASEDSAAAASFRRLIEGDRGAVVVAEEDGVVLGQISVSFNLAIRYPTLDGGHADTPMVQVPARRCK